MTEYEQAEADFPPDDKIQIHSYGCEIVLVVIKRIGQLTFELSTEEARMLAESLVRAADRVDGNECEGPKPCPNCGASGMEINEWESAPGRVVSIVEQCGVCGGDGLSTN